MKIKTALSITTFTTTFSISLMLVSFSVNKVALRIFKTQINPQNQLQIYNFLQQNAQNEKNKIRSLEKRNFRLSDSDAESFVNPLKEYGEISGRMDTSGLPEDFQSAWKKYATIEREWADFLTHLKSMPNQLIINKSENEIAGEKIADEKKAWAEIISVADKYEIAIDSNGVLKLQ